MELLTREEQGVVWAEAAPALGEKYGDSWPELPSRTGDLISALTGEPQRVAQVVVQGMEVDRID